jgi:hypothetical protein
MWETFKPKIQLSNGKKLKVKVYHNETYNCKFVYLYDGFQQVAESPMYAEWVDIPFIFRQLILSYLAENNLNMVGVI